MSADYAESRPLHKFPGKSGKDIIEAQYKGGRGVIEKVEWARVAYESLRKRCPHVPEEEMIRLFYGRSQSQLELIQGAAIFKEYNATHPLGRKRVKPRRGAKKPVPVETRETPQAKEPPKAAAKAKAPAKKAPPKAKKAPVKAKGAARKPAAKAAKRRR